MLFLAAAVLGFNLVAIAQTSSYVESSSSWMSRGTYFVSLAGAKCPVRAHWVAPPSLPQFTICTWFRVGGALEDHSAHPLFTYEGWDSDTQSHTGHGFSLGVNHDKVSFSSFMEPGQKQLTLTMPWVPRANVTNHWNRACLRWKGPESPQGGAERVARATSMNDTAMNDTATSDGNEPVSSTPSSTVRSPTTTPPVTVVADVLINGKVILDLGQLWSKKHYFTSAHSAALVQGAGGSGHLWLQKDKEHRSYADYGALTIWSSYLSDEDVGRSANCSRVQEQHLLYELVNASGVLGKNEQQEECFLMEPFDCQAVYRGVVLGSWQHTGGPGVGPGRGDGSSFPVLAVVIGVALLVVVSGTVITIVLCNRGHCDRFRSKYRGHRALRSHRRFSNPSYGSNPQSDPLTSELMEEEADHQAEDIESNGAVGGASLSARDLDQARVEVHQPNGVANGRAGRGGRKAKPVSDRLVMLTEAEEMERRAVSGHGPGEDDTNDLLPIVH